MRYLLLYIFLYSNIVAAQELTCQQQEQKALCSCLTQRLNSANRAYEQGMDTGLSDAQYDGLLAYKRSLTCPEGEGPESDETSKAKISLYSPMGSLHKIYIAEQARNRLSHSQEQWLIQPKFDGIAIELIYRDGRLSQAATRGNGLQGQNVLFLLSQVSNVPHSIPSERQEVVRGELLSLPSCHQNYATQYITTRQMAAALANTDIPLHGLDAEIVAKLTCLAFYPYEWLNSSVDSELKSLQVLHSWGFANMAALSLPVTVDSLLSQARALGALHPFDTDGYVLKIAKRSMRGIEVDARYRPSWAFAWKSQSPALVTKVKAIKWHIGRTGKITPVIHIEEVSIEGRRLKQLSAHSLSWMNQHRINQGALIAISLKGGAIAQVDSVILPSNQVSLIPKEMQNAAKPSLCLVNSKVCKLRFWQQIAYSLHKVSDAPLQEKAIKLWTEEQGLNSWLALFTLTKAQWLALSAENGLELYSAFAQIKKQGDSEQILTLLGPKGIGPTKIETLARAYPKFSQLQLATTAELFALKGIGPKRAAELQNLVSKINL